MRQKKSRTEKLFAASPIDLLLTGSVAQAKSDSQFWSAQEQPKVHRLPPINSQFKKSLEVSTAAKRSS